MKKIKFNRILFVNHNSRPDWTKDKTLIFFPLGLCKIVSVVERKGYDFDILDLSSNGYSVDDIEDKIKNVEYSVIALGGLTHAYSHMKILVSTLKKYQQNAVFVLGNAIASSIPELLIEKAGVDICVIGDGEESFIEILDALQGKRELSDVSGIVFRRGEKIFRTQNRVLVNMNNRDSPIWDLFDVESYILSAKNYKNLRHYDISKERPMPINTSKGCPFRCTFCANSYFYKENPWRYHSPEYVIREIVELKKKFNVTYLWFWDELTFLSPQQSRSLLQALVDADLGIKFSATCRVGLFKPETKDIADLLYKAGCVLINYSLESGNKKILKAMNKKINLEAFSIQKKVLDDAGVPSATNIIIGYPDETLESIDETFELCLKNKVFPSMGYLLPLPNTPMFNYAKQHGLIGDLEEYVIGMTDRQIFKINLTRIADDKLQKRVYENSLKIRDAMNLDLTDDQLICSTVMKR